MWVNSQILVSSSAFVRLCVRAVNALHHQQPTEGQTTDECFYFEGEKCLPELQFPSAWKQHMNERSPIRTDLGDTLRCLTGFCITRLWLCDFHQRLMGTLLTTPPPPLTTHTCLCTPLCIPWIHSQFTIIYFSLSSINKQQKRYKTGIVFPFQKIKKHIISVFPRVSKKPHQWLLIAGNSSIYILVFQLRTKPY